jgi:cysteine-S-conjugate beta-lyase
MTSLGVVSLPVRAEHRAMGSSRFDRVIDRTGTGSEKWERYAGRDVLPMWVADMDFETASPVVEALERRARHGVFGYTVPDSPARDAVVAHCASRHGWTVDPSWILFFTGVNKITAAAVRALTEPGDSILVCTPVYPPLHLAPAGAGRKLVAVPLLRDAAYRYTIDFDALDRAAATARMLILCSPHNPVGRVWSPGELQRVADIAGRHNLLVLSDEIFADLTLDGRAHTPFATVAGIDPRRVVTGMSASKTFNLAGLACAFAIIPDAEARRRMKAMLRTVTAPDLNAFAYVGMEAALNHGEPWRRELVAYLAANRDALAAAFARDVPEVRMTAVEATFLAWLDVTALGLEDPHAFFVNAGLGLSDGRDFLGPGHVRMNFGCPRSMLEEGIRRFTAAVRSLREDG